MKRILVFFMVVSAACHAQSGDASQYLEQATVRMQMRDYRAAIDDCDSALRLRPGYTDAIALRGDAKLGLKNYKAAIADFDIILTTEPDRFHEYFRKRSVAKYMILDYAGSDADRKTAERYTPPNTAQKDTTAPQTAQHVTTKTHGDTPAIAPKAENAQPQPSAAMATPPQITKVPVAAKHAAIFKNTWLDQYLRDTVITPLRLSRAIATESDKGPLYAARGLISQHQGRGEDACSDFRMAKELGYKEADGMIEAYCK